MIDIKKQFYIGINGRSEDSFSIKHIQYNIHSKIFSLDYNKYRRIDLLISLNEGNSGVFLLLNDGRKASLRTELELDIKNVESPESIQLICNFAFDALKVLWNENSWPVNDLTAIKEEIVKEDYVAVLQWGKKLRASDTKTDMRIICKFYPGVTEYYLQFSLNDSLQLCRFFRGFSDPVMFFGYFTQSKWVSSNFYSISDIDEEISFVIDIKKGACEVVINPRNHSHADCLLILKAFESSGPEHILSVMKF